MSWDYTIYVGPFVQCSTRTSPSTKKVTVCANQACPDSARLKELPHGYAHCPKCGSRTATDTVKVEGQVRDDIDPWTVVEGTKERLTTGGTSNCRDDNPGTHLFIPNMGGPRNFAWCRDDPKTGLLLDDIPTKVVEETAWFMREYAKAIDFCKETYGEKNVRVRWGVLGSAG